MIYEVKKHIPPTDEAEKKKTTNQELFDKHLFAVDKGASERKTTKEKEIAVLVENQALQDFKSRRAALVNAEVDHGWDRDARKGASETEKKAAFIVRELREFERDCPGVFGNIASEAIPPSTARDMGGQFLTNKERIETKSKLFEIAWEAPKGALLHLHFNAELSPETLLEQARKMSNMFVWCTVPLLTTEDLSKAEMMFKVLPEKTESQNIFSTDYKGGGDSWKHEAFNNQVWMKWREFMADFEVKFPKMPRRPKNNNPAKHCANSASLELNAAENWILQKMVLSEAEAYHPTQTVNGVWARFNQATRCFKGLVNYRKVYEWYINEAIDQMIKEKVMYAELRPMLMDKFIPSDDGTQKILNREQMELIEKCITKKKEQLVDAKKGHLFPFGLKIIYCTPRSIPKPMMRSEMLDCISLKRDFPNLICGFDLVGAEDRKNHIGFYGEELVAFQELCRENKVDIPFLFHAGETLLDTGGSKDPHNSNLFDAVALNSKRIGHGFSLLKHADLVEHFKPRNGNPGICVELCPISNELLHLCRNIKEHPYPELLAAGVPCTVNSDNPSLFSNSMAHEFYQIMVGSPSISLHSWKQLALWSLEYSCLNDEEKTEGKKIFLAAWEEFCAWVVKEFDEYFEDDVVETPPTTVLLPGNGDTKQYTTRTEKTTVRKLKKTEVAELYGVSPDSVPVW
ncbi:cat eye syndrome critical region protein 1 [Byssothecium circinans]|uniref:Cat eye syndrome critical region protein 1 n=1 Tax=Byssothecium circinans TaxID=147558 RepID=A0A6A5U4A4_9PLEO|nr:cat eye syndrome critical region protein 1 [Byssothecium circinans]